MRARWLVPPLLLVAGLGAWLLVRGSEPQAPPVEPSAPLATPAEESAEPAPEAASARVELASPEVAPREEGLDDFDAEALAAGPVVEIDAASAPVLLRGRLRDDHDQLPLADFRVVFELAGAPHGAGHRAEAVTDARGEFQCAEPLLVGRLLARFLDREGRKRAIPPWTIEIEDVRKGVLDLEIPAGATYALAFAPRDAIDPAGVELRLRAPDPRAKEAWVSEWEPVRAGEPAWVRFALPAGGLVAAERIEARTQDGLWWGSAEARVARGRAPGVTLVAFESRAVLAGRVLDGAGQPVADADVLLRARDASARELQRRAQTGADGSFRFVQLPGATGTLRASSLRHLPVEQGVTLLPGRVQESDLLLAPLPIAGAIRVHVESESGSYTPDFRLRLTLEEDPEAEAGGRRFERRVQPEWVVEDGRRLARFEFAELPSRSFRLQVEKDDFFAWDPQRLVLRPPAEDVRIRIQDGLPNADLSFRVRDELTGEELAPFRLSLEFPGSRVAPRQVDSGSGRVFLTHLPLERKLAWRLDAAGHAPAVGNLDAFQVIEQRDGREVRVCELVLRPGWGEYYRFLDARSRNPVAGVHVLLDGVDSGTSDERGCVLVRHVPRPARQELTCAALGIEQPRALGNGRRQGRVTEVLIAAPAPRKNQKKGGG